MFFFVDVVVESCVDASNAPRTFLTFSSNFEGERSFPFRGPGLSVMAPRQRGCARASSSTSSLMTLARKSPLSLVVIVGVAIIAAAASGGSLAFASAQATTTTTAATHNHHTSRPPPPPFDPAAGWPSSGVRTLDVTLPPAETVEDEEYLCTSVPLPDGIPLGLTRVEPLASAAVVHHILLFGELSFYGERRSRAKEKSTRNCLVFKTAFEKKSRSIDCGGAR